jgi:hypothetical protein
VPFGMKMMELTDLAPADFVWYAHKVAPVMCRIVQCGK